MSVINYKYFAFISYSHKDSYFVEKLHKRLEDYRLPSIVRKENPLLPKTVQPIFRDKTNLTSGMLQQELNKELERSKYLIVICSPNSASAKDNKHWVNEEVEYFKKLGREENIIPVIIDGEPNSKDSEKDCYCNALKSNSLGDEFLGIDAKIPKNLKISKGKRFLGIPDENDTEEKALNHIIARMLGLDFDDLWQRYRKQQLKKAYKRIISLVSFLLIVTIGSLIVWNNFFRVTHKFYVDYVDKCGIPQGIGELKKDQLEGRYGFFNFSYRAGKLREVRYENVYGTVKEFLFSRPNFSEDKNFKLFYSEDGELSEIVTYEKNREAVIYEQRPDLNYNRVNLTERGKETTDISKMNLSLSLTQEETPTSITSYSYVRDELGYIKQQIFRKYHNSNVLAQNSEGITGFEYSYNDIGQIIEKKYLSAKDSTTVQVTQVKGIQSFAYKYDENHNLIEKVNLDEYGNKVINKTGYASVRYEYDERGNVIKESYYGLDGKPVFCSDGYASLEVEYDERGNFVKVTFLGIDGFPVINTDGGCACIQFKYDENDNKIEVNYYDVLGQPCLILNGYAVVKLEYNEKNIQIKESYFDAEYKPILSKDGFASMEDEYDTRGNLIKESYFDVGGNLITIIDGYASLEGEYDERGNIIKIKFFGTDKLPILTVDGYASLTTEYDERGNAIKLCYFGIDGKPILTSFGFATFTSEYDERNNKIKESYFGANGKPILSIWGDAGYISEYDERGNCIKINSFGIDYNPILNAQGYTTRKSEYDKYNNLVKESFFGIDEKPILLEKGYSEIQYKYDDYYNLVSTIYIDLYGNIVQETFSE